MVSRWKSANERMSNLLRATAMKIETGMSVVRPTHHSLGHSFAENPFNNGVDGEDSALAFVAGDWESTCCEVVDICRL